jgi:hypothetical protein
MSRIFCKDCGESIKTRKIKGKTLKTIGKYKGLKDAHLLDRKHVYIKEDSGRTFSRYLPYPKNYFLSIKTIH